jgi:hypothetical protein
MAFKMPKLKAPKTPTLGNWWDDVVDGVTDAEKAAEKAATDAANAAAKAATDAANAATKAAQDAFEEAERLAEEAEQATYDAAKAFADALAKAANDAAQAATDISNAAIASAAGILDITVEDVTDGVNQAIKDINETVLEPIAQVSVDALVEAADARLDLAVDEFKAGCVVAAVAIEAGAVQVEEGLVAIGEYLESHACNLALGGLITGAFAGMLNTPASEVETTAMFAPLSAATADTMVASAVEEVAYRAVSATVASAMVEVVWTIPDVRKGVGHSKDALVASVAFLIQCMVQTTPWALLSPQTASVAVAGLVGYVVSSLVCDGTLPGMES